MTESDREEKFMDCASRVLGKAGAEKLLELCHSCRSLADIGELARATVPAG
jgi:hypothetical protein